MNFNWEFSWEDAIGNLAGLFLVMAITATVVGLIVLAINWLTKPSSDQRVVVFQSALAGLFLVPAFYFFVPGFQVIPMGIHGFELEAGIDKAEINRTAYRNSSGSSAGQPWSSDAFETADKNRFGLRLPVDDTRMKSTEPGYTLHSPDCLNQPVGNAEPGTKGVIRTNTSGGGNSSRPEQDSSKRLEYLAGR